MTRRVTGGTVADVTWRKLITEAAESVGDTGALVACTLTEAELDVEFDDGFGMPEGKPFTAWTETRVYFPVCYDGAETVSSAPRNPCDEAHNHRGGW